MKKKITIAILCIVSAVCLCGCQIIKGGPRRGYLSERDASEHMLKEIIQYTEEKIDSSVRAIPSKKIWWQIVKCGKIALLSHEV